MSLDGKVLQNGGSPILVEPVKARIAMIGRTIAAVNVLDQDGRRSGEKLEVNNGAFSIDGTRDKTLYYEIVFR